jgi:hypothetical protein
VVSFPPFTVRVFLDERQGAKYSLGKLETLYSELKDELTQTLKAIEVVERATLQLIPKNNRKSL